MKREQILITGGAGYIGSLLAPMLLERGHTVTIFDNFMYGTHSVLGFAMHPNLRLIKGDVRDASAVERVVREHDWVFHLAAIVGYPACAADPVMATTVNIEGTRNVMKALGKQQRVVFASTGSTYGKVVDVATEETPIAPLTLYGKTKSDGEALVREHARNFSILRFATVFGSSPRMRLDLIVNDFVYQALHNRQIVLFEGHFRRTFLHSSDAAASYLFTMDHFEKMNGGVFNVGDEAMNCTKRDVANKIKEYVDYYLHEAAVGTDKDQRDYGVDYSRIKTLGYRAKVTLEAGIRELIKILSILTFQHPMRNA
ncbi:MAG TPA: NAD(P)-dependent oxidoreductase [Polyangia bacterium]|nr:NAD(P)-dependent oxidoreductase [Polyangia bacterium]